ncbi:diguanylate phosphodiesterase [Devosia insulae DS-56]|uniref:Diguanylate phosphodiesterase n=1 Tax=Devosia insulae DS-56 TaxID=1116389 RepID=A0A1E5XRI3_9HYPH|nr:EAL domain-containing protein [Devosia insulae]OEO31198.1 diguanylate phosphodiesterase [Devosia insulae DS-56]
MQVVIDTLLHNHDLALVAVAALLCALSSFAGISLLHHARRTTGRLQLVWLGVAAVSVGFGIWATHFVAMLAFHPGVAVGYDLPTTLASLSLAIAIVGGGLWFATIGTSTGDSILAGGVVGLGISVMHYTGMAAVIVGGSIVWDGNLVALSILTGMALGAAALWLARASTLRGRVGAPILLTLAICAMHFTAMGAAGFADCYAIVAEGTPTWLWLVLSLASTIILGLAMGGTLLDLRDRRHSAESVRMRELADAAVEGIVIVRQGIISATNRSFRQLVGSEADASGQPLLGFLDAEACGALERSPNATIEGRLRVAGGDIPVEAVAHEIEFQGVRQRAIAIRDVSTRKQAEEHIRFLAHHDALTGLPNRVSFGRRLNETIDRARSDGQSCSVLCLDLDKFKEVNDLYGHAAGDALLRRVGLILQREVAEIGYPARLSGDEFAVVLNATENLDAANRVAQRLLQAFAHDVADTADDASISASIGIASFPGDAESAEQLMSAADMALYRAKQDGRGAYRLFEATMNDELRDRRLVANDLANAADAGQLDLAYQPQVDLITGDVTGFEALIRWRHPERGEVPPGIFIPIAEENGLILGIGEWVLRTACAEAAGWRVPLSISVNVSAAQIHNPAFARLIHEVLIETGLSPARLEIEVTETALVRDLVRAVTTLRQVRGLGVRVAIDDFGTGHSSLTHLSAFPFSRIKLDQSFVRTFDRNPQSAAIVHAVVELGRYLGTPVVAEGVERREELAFLRAEGCATAQGFLFGYPAPIGTFVGLQVRKAS